ncbi:MAG: AbrB/MazE/SpoVT family DNA-binding domain-containing protein [Candidatus Abyssobacteria bacterium SURF_5]|uniref:AbrB/MazE/SpoVT family DNA-binding domain-containing protein n=1 Tax=Abyssobacteria bacterium (strain SURF_5) TaxID=2093360 RepID=A0A3A4N7C2_ABYX5|nr:MAG: AbrB/MazE/SpoVT family DNA-binding domain-containing protein [Candidatus Abyssubacteria bacterium SURF_5]
MRKKRKKSQGDTGLERASGPAPCCRIEALVSLDARGQVLLPKEVREKAGLQTGDKLAVVLCEADDTVARITLIKAEAFAQTAREMLGPMMGMIEDTNRSK